MTEELTTLIANYNRDPQQFAAALAAEFSRVIRDPKQREGLSDVLESLESLREFWDALDEETAASILPEDRDAHQSAIDTAFRGEEDVASLVETTLLPSLSSETARLVEGIRPLYVFASTQAVSTRLFNLVARQWNPKTRLELRIDGSIGLNGQTAGTTDDVARVVARHCNLFGESGELMNEAYVLARWLPHAAREQPRLLQHFGSGPDATAFCRLMLLEAVSREDDVFQRWSLGSARTFVVFAAEQPRAVLISDESPDYVIEQLAGNPIARGVRVAVFRSALAGFGSAPTYVTPDLQSFKDAIGGKALPPSVVRITGEHIQVCGREVVDQVIWTH